MSKESMSITVDSELKEAFIKCVDRFYPNRTLEEGIIDLMKIYVQKANGTPHQSEIMESIRENVYEGDRGGGPQSIEIEKILLNKTDADIEANRL